MTDDYRRGALAVTEEWSTVLAVLASDVLDSIDCVADVTVKTEGHPYFVGKLALINALRAMVESDLKRFHEAPHD